jgi:NADH-quinone oxidoreductase subunit L
MFHLMTHAFFKALLFMGAGIVIHALGGEQDIRKMGGIRRLMPYTAIAMWIGGLALVGLPPFAGFFSKDSILAAALDHGAFGAVLWVCGEVGAFLTGLYTFRMLFIVFGGETTPFVREHHHRMHRDLVGVALAAPVAVLAVLSVVGGWIQFAGVWTGISNWLDPVAQPLVEASGIQETVSSIVAVGLGLAGIAVAWWIYGARRTRAPKPVTALERKLWWDEAYDVAFYHPSAGSAVWLQRLVERPLIGGSITGIATAFRDLGLGARTVQTGLVRSYALAFAAGVAVLAVVFISVK